MENIRYPCQIFEKHSNIKCDENPSSRSRVVPCGRAGRRTDRQIDMTQLMVAIRNFANALKFRDITSEHTSKAFNI